MYLTFHKKIDGNAYNSRAKLLVSREGNIFAHKGDDNCE